MTKQYLQQYLWCVQEQKRLESRIAAVREEMEGIRGIIVSDMPKGGGRDNEKLEKLIDLKQDLINEVVAGGKVGSKKAYTVGLVEKGKNDDAR